MSFLPEGGRNHDYRVLAIAVIFFGTGLFFFLSDHPWAPASAPSSAARILSSGAAPAQQAGATVQSSPLSPAFANFPPPSQLRTFAYASGTIDGAQSFAVSSTCADASVAVLVFPSSVDYRAAPNRAVYNQAFPCTASSGIINVTIAPADLGNVPSGTYYYFTVVPATDGTWYNPK